MTIEAISGTGLKYYLVAFDADGNERADDPDGLMSKRVLEAFGEESYTDVFILSHGWKGDVPAAKDQYHRWLAIMAQCHDDIERMRQARPGFNPLLVGLHWPSLPWGDEELGRSSESFAPRGVTEVEKLIEEYAQRIADTPRAREALRTIFESAKKNVYPQALPAEVREAYRTLNQESGMESEGAAAAPGDDREPFDPDSAYEAAREEEDEASFGDTSLGGLLSPLRQLSFWKMKDRARKFGEAGGFQFLKNLQQKAAETRDARFHLMGHSFGCIVVSAMVAGPKGRGELLRPVDSVALIQGALSLWSYCADVPPTPGKPGYFNSIVAGKRVRGPIITTQSRHDTAVGRFYPLGAGIRGEVDFAVTLPRYGGLGAFGVRGLKDVVKDQRMLARDAEYGFQPGLIYNLEGSEFIRDGGGVSGAHNDIARPEVAHAVWEAARAAG